MLLFLTIAIGLSVAYEINKCCPDGEAYEYSGEGHPKCVSIDDSPFVYNSSYFWLPESANLTAFENWDINFNATPTCQYDHIWIKNFSLTFNESFVLLKHGKEKYKYNSFCVENFNDEFIIAQVCENIKRLSIPKCCEKGQYFNDTYHCIDSNNEIDWIFNSSIIEKYKIINRFYVCELLNETAGFFSEFNSDGYIFSNKDPIEYCGEYKQESDDSKVEIIIVCFDVKPSQSSYYGVISLMGAFFILITIAVLCWIPELGGSPKWCLTVQVMCLFVAYISLAYQQLSPWFFGENFCKIIGFVARFFFVASYFWLNVLCINFTQTFYESKTLTMSNKKVAEKRSFILFSLYAWSGSLIITLVTIGFEMSYPLEDLQPMPNYGEIECWSSKRQAVWLYLFGPVGVLQLFNLGLFAFISYKLIIFKRKFKTSKNEKNKHRLFFLLILFFWMGIPWVAEIISWAVDRKNIAWSYFWYITNFMNLLRAVFIFIMVCCNKMAWNNINRKAPWIGRGKEHTKGLFCAKGLIENKANKPDTITVPERYTPEVNEISLEQIKDDPKSK